MRFGSVPRLLLFLKVRAVLPLALAELQSGREPVETNRTMNTIRRHAADGAHVNGDTACDDSQGDPPRVTVTSARDRLQAPNSLR